MNIKFVKITLDGSSVIVPPKDVNTTIMDMDIEDDYTMEDIYMTQKEYDNLEEFQGF